MNVDDVIREFAEVDGVLPKDSMRWALDHWDVAADRFIDLLTGCADGTDRNDETIRALFFVIFLLGERRETRAFPVLCRLLQDNELSADILGDAITQSLTQILIGTYDGNADALKSVIESATADEYARAGALEAMAYLTRTGAFTDEEMRAYLRHLLAEMQPRVESIIWLSWAFVASNLGYEDMAGDVEELMKCDLIDPLEMPMDDFHRHVRLAREDADGMAGFRRDRIGPLTDSIAMLSTWYGFSEAYRSARAEALAEAAACSELDEETPRWSWSYEPAVNPLRHVGRNDPCPCGSGLKYKKCCLQ